VVRIENYRVIKKLMLVAKPNVVLNHFFDHMGDKRSLIREDVLNIVMYALLTFPSNEFDLKVCIFFIYNVLNPSASSKKIDLGPCLKCFEDGAVKYFCYQSHSEFLASNSAKLKLAKEKIGKSG
jgi:hypothetical protein